MPFFQPAYLSPEAQFFSTLLSSLDDQPQRKSCGPRPARVPTYTPRFDITESANAYELYGEVPGIEQADVSIEFSDAQTLVIKGKTERSNTVATPAETETEKHVENDAASEKSHNPTVEDEYDEADTPLATPATTAATVVADAPATSEAAPQEPRPKFWVQERKVGQFARSFSFAQRIDQDNVIASLKNGILHVVVPKSQKARKVAVSVN